MAEDIYGPIIPHLKRNTLWRNFQHVEPVQITSVTKNILDKYKEVTTCCDLMDTQYHKCRTRVKDTLPAI